MCITFFHSYIFARLVARILPERRTRISPWGGILKTFPTNVRFPRKMNINLQPPNGSKLLLRMNSTLGVRLEKFRPISKYK